MRDLNPTIEVESARGIREIALKTRHFMDRKIFLTGEINAEMANAFLSEILFLEQEPTKPVTIYINSPGGEVNAGLMIYDVIQGSGLEINMDLHRWLQVWLRSFWQEGRKDIGIF